MSGRGPAGSQSLVYGFHPVSELLRALGRSPVRGLMVARQRRVDELVALAERAKIPVQQASAEELSALCGSDSHQGVVALVGEYRYCDLEDLLEPAEAPPFVVFLDGVLDPQNLGSILRSALVLGAHGVVIPQNRAAAVTPSAVRVSAGAAMHLPCARVTNLARSLDQAKEAGLWVAGAVESGGQHPVELDLTGPLALVLGSEQKGIRPLVRKQCDYLLTLPSAGAVASLNVAAATAVLCYEVARQRLYSSR